MSRGAASHYSKSLQHQWSGKALRIATQIIFCVPVCDIATGLAGACKDCHSEHNALGNHLLVSAPARREDNLVHIDLQRCGALLSLVILSRDI